MYVNKRNLRLIMGITTLVIVGVTGFIYTNQQTKAREDAEKQALIAKIDRQQALEYQAESLKEGSPKVDIAPARINKVLPSNADGTEITKSPDNDNAVTRSNVHNEFEEAITTLSDENIRHLQSYKQFDGNGGSYKSFGVMYVEERAGCEALMKKFSAITLSDYSKAKAEWLTSPHLVYRSLISQYCVRGIISLTYYTEVNKFGLKPNVKYQREVEYQLRNSVTNGKSTLKLENIEYLSDFKAVK